MPTTAAIVWIGISGIIVLMLGIIGYLLNTGFAGIKEQFKTLWDKIDRHQTQAEINALAIAAINARCDERHANHKRATD